MSDLISREETLTAFADYVGSGMSMDDYDALWDIVAKMPPVNPQPCEDAISRQAVTDTTICDGISCNECSFNTCEDGQAGCLLKERVDKLPPVNPAKTGHWMPVKGYEGILWECSECHNKRHHTTIKWDYCPNCGAKMVEPQERNDKA